MARPDGSFNHRHHIPGGDAGAGFSLLVREPSGSCNRRHGEHRTPCHPKTSPTRRVSPSPVIWRVPGEGFPSARLRPVCRSAGAKVRGWFAVPAPPQTPGALERVGGTRNRDTCVMRRGRGAGDAVTPRRVWDVGGDKGHPAGDVPSGLREEADKNQIPNSSAGSALGLIINSNTGKSRFCPTRGHQTGTEPQSPPRPHRTVFPAALIGSV